MYEEIPEGYPCSEGESTRVYDEGLQMGEYDAQSGHPYNEDPASGYPEGTPLHQSYQCGYRHGWQ